MQGRASTRPLMPVPAAMRDGAAWSTTWWLAAVAADYRGTDWTPAPVSPNLIASSSVCAGTTITRGQMFDDPSSILLSRWLGWQPTSVVRTSNVPTDIATAR